MNAVPNEPGQAIGQPSRAWQLLAGQRLQHPRTQAPGRGLRVVQPPLRGRHCADHQPAQGEVGVALEAKEVGWAEIQSLQDLQRDLQVGQVEAGRVEWGQEDIAFKSVFEPDHFRPQHACRGLHHGGVTWLLWLQGLLGLTEPTWLQGSRNFQLTEHT